MLELIVAWLPFIILIGVFLVFSVLFLRSMGQGGSGRSYMSLMQKLADAQIETAAQAKRQADAMERIAEALEKR